MAEPINRAVTQIVDWPGLETNSGPSSGGLPDGAAEEQVNLRVNVPGELAVRPGYRVVAFDTEG